MLIRAYAPADLDQVIEVFRQSVRLSARTDYTASQVLAWAPDELDREGWSERLARQLVWIAEESGVAVGFCTLEPDGHLDLMYVHPAQQRRGFATALLRRAEAAARERAAPRLYTEASITARPFFEYCGFRTLAEQTVRLRGEQFRNFKMEKVLGPEGAKVAPPE